MNGFALELPGRPRRIPVSLTRGSLARGGPVQVPEQSATVLLIVDGGAWSHWADPLREFASRLGQRVLEPLVLEGGEATKRAEALPGHWRALAERGATRDTCVACVGGGAVLDTGGFLAATWLRGLRHLVVPTTLLGAVDAALGGKTGVNLDLAKNQVGAFKQPEAVLVDPELLTTAPEDSHRSGLGEVLKTALIDGEDMVVRLEGFAEDPRPENAALDALLLGCLRCKGAIVAADELESGRRSVLNLGHTVGHVLESQALAEGRPVPHGEAVAAGLLAELRLTAAEGGLARRVARLLGRLGLPERLPLGCDREQALGWLLRDKKRSSAGILVPVLEEPGRVRLETRAPEQLLEAVAAACSGP